MSEYKHRILITGGNGLLGQKLTDLLAFRPAVELMTTSLGPNRNPERKGYVYESLDITDYSQLRHVFERFRPTEVINSAALTNVDFCETNIEASYALNVRAVTYLCELCKVYNSHLFHLSTDFVFDGLSGPYAENAATKPLSVYGNHKLQAEQVILQANIPAAIIRTALLYGWVPNLSRSNIVLWVKQSLENNKPIRVVSDQIRTPTLAEDLADGVARALFKKATGIYHISGAEMLSVYALAQKVAAFWKLDSSLIEEANSSNFSQPAKRPLKTGFIILKAQTELNFKPHSLQEGFQIVEHQLQRNS